MRTFLQQGKLDGLCGLYSTLNLFDYLKGPFCETQHNFLFEKLVKHQPNIWPACLYQGSTSTTVIKWIKKAARLCDTKVEIVKPYKNRSDIKLSQYWDEIQYLTRPRDTAAIIGIGEPWNHWTVVTHIRNRRIYLRDSYGLKSRRLDWFGTTANKVDVCIKETILVQLKH